ncbi:gamma-glutamyl kinase [Roseobacter sp. HKCCA0434]|uniref:gamma-glutamyl kinase n=1 Tax=Roseobacter sp. HKCCA0434 TaxID=3079297 RepID=UPI0029058212|nr:gamma-glutamyl kinase [Roseobacter sp. HKCCA0434]
MLISLKARVAYLAVPKTGSTAIEAALAPHCDVVLSGHPQLKHMRLRRFERQVRPILPGGGEGIETVAMIREPLDWLGSWYRYRTRPELSGPNSTAGIGFDQFVRDWLSDDPPRHARVGMQSAMLAPPADGPGLAHLFVHERPGPMIAFLQERFGVPIALDRRNVSPEMALTLDPATEAAARAAMAEDYALHSRAMEAAGAGVACG